MNFNSVKKIKGVSDFLVKSNHLFYKLKQNDKELFLNEELFDMENFGYHFFEDFICLNQEFVTDFVNLATNEKFTIPVTFTGLNYDNNTFITSKDILREGIGLYSSKYTINQLIPYKELYELPNRYYGSGYRFGNSYIQISNNRTTLKSLFLLTGKYEWERELPINKIIQVIGIYEKSLIVTYESVENETGVIAINVTNGETIWDKTVEGMYQFYPLFSKKGDSVVNLHCGSYYLNGVQIAQSANVFTEINLTDGSLVRNEVLKDLDNLGLGVDKFIVEGDYIYFTATYQGSFGAVAIGVLEYESLALLWWQVVEMQAADGFGNFLMNKPVVGGDKLYILDKTSVLHIFERTEA